MTLSASAATAQPPRAAPAAPQPALTSGTYLSLEQAMLLARSRSPDVRLAEHRIREAEATRVGAGLILPVNPRLIVEARPSLLQNAYPTRHLGYGATLDVLFDVGGAPSARVREARMRARAAQAESEVTRFHAALTACRLYLAATIAQQRIEELQEALTVARRVMDAARERITAGASGDIDVETARLEVAQIEALLAGAVREHDVHMMGLRDALDMRGDQSVILTTKPGAPPPPPALATLLEQAQRKRPELAATRSRMDLIEATDERLEREVVPRVGVFTGLDAAPYSAMFWSVGASVELPVAQRNRGPRAVAARELETERARLDLEQRRIAREVMAARAAYDARRTELKLLSEQAIPAAERNLTLIETGWRSGRFDVFRVTAASRDLLRSRALRLDALEAAWLDRIALEQAAGGWPP